MRVRLVRLMSGEELIAKIEDKGEAYLLTDVVQVLTSVAADKKLKVSFIPFMPIARTEAGVVILKSFCAIVIEPVDSVLESYNLLWGADEAEAKTPTPTEPPIIQTEPQPNDLVPKRKGTRAKAAVVKPSLAFVKG